MPAAGVPSPQVAGQVRPEGSRVVLAVSAHPDDVEFVMGGTLRLLVERGWEAHVLPLCTGHAGSTDLGPEELALMRAGEADRGAALLGATRHESMVNDLELEARVPLVRRVTALVRELRPRILLTHAPDDYMGDHVEAARIATAAAFDRGMPSFVSDPPRASIRDDVTVYHAQPHGLHDTLRRLVFPHLYVDIGTVSERKRDALAAHVSQSAWLGEVQGMPSPVETMDATARTVGAMSERFERAEGWRRHLHLGMSERDEDPLAEALGDLAHVDHDLEASLLQHPVTGRTVSSTRA